MATKRLAERITNAFPRDDPKSEEFASWTLNVVLSEWRDVAMAMRRSVLLMFLLIVAFQLLITANVAELTLGPFKVKDLTIAQALVPAVVAYAFYEFIVLTGVAYRLRGAREHLIRVLHPHIYDEDLEHIFSPGALSFTQHVHTKEIRSRQVGLAARLWSIASTGIAIAAIFGVLVFLVYAYLMLYQRDSSTVLVSTSALFSAVVIIAAVASAVDDMATSD
jgi:hypothetical protein